MNKMDLIVLAAAEAAHEANRIYCASIGDASQVPWKEAPVWQRESAIEGVRTALGGATPEEQHEAWCASKRRDGWTVGPVKDPAKKEHPCLVPYAELPPEQRAKDALYLAVVRGMVAALGGEKLGSEKLGSEKLGSEGPGSSGMKLNDLKRLFPRFDVDTHDHVLGHVVKATGKLYGLVGDADHIGEAHMGDALMPDMAEAFRLAEQTNGKGARAYVADLVICAAKLAELCPSGPFDLEEAVAARMNEKRDYLKQYKAAFARPQNGDAVPDDGTSCVGDLVKEHRARSERLSRDLQEQIRRNDALQTELDRLMSAYNDLRKKSTALEIELRERS